MGRSTGQYHHPQPKGYLSLDDDSTSRIDTPGSGVEAEKETRASTTTNSAYLQSDTHHDAQFSALTTSISYSTAFVSNWRPHCLLCRRNPAPSVHCRAPPACAGGFWLGWGLASFILMTANLTPCNASNQVECSMRLDFRT